GWCKSGEEPVPVKRRGAGAARGCRHRRGQTRRPAPDDDDVVAHERLAHPIPSRTTSTICATSSSFTTSSIQDTTRLLEAPYRLKKTPTPGRGRMAGTW